MTTRESRLLGARENFSKNRGNPALVLPLVVSLLVCTVYSVNPAQANILRTASGGTTGGYFAGKFGGGCVKAACRAAVHVAKAAATVAVEAPLFLFHAGMIAVDGVISVADLIMLDASYHVDKLELTGDDLSYPQDGYETKPVLEKNPEH